MSGALFDADHFAVMTGGDEALQREIVALFRMQAALWSRLLIPDAPVPTWAETAHTVKGSARGLGLWLLADACAEAEQMAKTGLKDGPAIALALDRVRRRLEEGLAALDAHLSGALHDRARIAAAS